MKKLYIITLFILCVGSQYGYSQSITVTGTWSASIAAGTITEAGTDYGVTTLSSLTNQSLLSVDDGPGNNNWRVFVKKTDIDWNFGLTLSLKRTGNGTGSGNFTTTTIGTTYIQLTALDQLFISGNKVINNIPIQYEIGGISVLIPAKSYSTQVVYTLSVP